MTIAATTQSLKQDFGKGAVIAPGEKVIEPIAGISTSCPQLDLALGVGGFPVGRIGELYGPESSGKTTLIYHLLAEAQKRGPCVFIDAEHAADPFYATAIGVDWDGLYFCQPDTAEEALEIANRFAKSGDVPLIAVDSVAALTPRAILEGQVGDQTVAMLPRLMSQAMGMLKGAANQSGTSIIFTNQIREKIGVVWGSPETQPGGRALKFYSSVRMDIRRKETVGKEDESTANRVKVKVVKNKVAPPYRTAEFEIRFGEGIDRAASILDLAVDREMVKKAGRFYTFTDDLKSGSRADALQLLRENTELAANLYAQIMEA